jgi:hypothetical protein
MNPKTFISFFLHLLIFLVIAKHGDASDNQADHNLLRLHSMDQQVDGHDAQAHHPSSAKHHHHHSDPSVIVFFMMEDLKQGMRAPVYFPKRDPSASPKPLPKQVADKIPFALNQLQNLLEQFSFSRSSPQAQAMEDTLRECEVRAIKGETKFCATSVESMLDFTRGILGLDAQVKVLATKHLTESTTHFQNYTVLGEPVQIPAPKMVACHTMPYPYQVLYCHSQNTDNRVFRVLLKGDNGDMVEAISVCHLDTSEWSKDHMAFRVLGIDPGTSSVCHFFPADNFVCVP